MILKLLGKMKEGKIMIGEWKKKRKLKKNGVK
jgi:hypothetical protein